MLGHFDGINENGEIFGWALDPSNPEQPLTLTVYVDGLPLCEVLGAHHRPDVGKAFGSRGLNAFFVDLAKYCPSGTRALVEVCLPNGRFITENPIAVDIPARPTKHNNPLLFMHIPKTAGTSVREAIAENYLISELVYLYPDPPGIQELRQLPLEQRARLSCVIGHFKFGVHRHIPRSSHYVTLVRDPVERVISHYSHMAARFPERLTVDGRLLSICDAVERRITCDLDNLMVRYFAGVDDVEVLPGTLSGTHYEEAVRNLQSEFLFVGHREDAQASFNHMAALFQWQPAQVGSRMVNHTSGRYDSESDRVAAVIREYNSWDTQLYDEILKRFPRRKQCGTNGR